MAPQESAVFHLKVLRTKFKFRIDLNMNDSPYRSCFAKQQRVKLLFSTCLTPESKYEKIILLGRELPSFPPELKLPAYLVKGCQSQMYLHTTFHEGCLRFKTFSEALISAGLSALLLAVYNDETPETLLGCPPLFLEELGIHSSLSPGRSNGLSSLFLRMKQDAVNFLINNA